MSRQPHQQQGTPANIDLADTNDPLNPKVAASALDFLLIELVPLAQRITEQLLAREQVLLDEYRRSRIFGRRGSKTARKDKVQGEEGGAAEDGGGKAEEGKEEGEGREGEGEKRKEGGGKAETGSVMTSIGFPVMGEGVREGVLARLDGMGYRVGQGLAERFTLNTPRPTNPLEAIKFICKDLWLLVFRKQIDNLKTNHRGIFVLTDTRFQPISRMSIDRRAGPKAAEEAMARAVTYLYFPCGVIRGALMGLGVEATVEASASELPIATFQIKTKGAKP